jgi:flagellar basal body P-ring formation protein FlgA
MVVLGFWLNATSAVLAREVMMPVPARTILPGQELEAKDFRFRLFEVNDTAMKTYVVDVAQLRRMAAAKGLPANKPVPLQAIRSVHDVRKGKPAIAIYSNDAVSIQGMLTPLVDAAAGETIEARNVATGGRVRALVQRDGTLLVITK